MERSGIVDEGSCVGRMSRSIIDFVERNIHGAWVVWGDLGIRQYYGYTKKESMKKYRQEWLETVAPFICQEVK